MITLVALNILKSPNKRKTCEYQTENCKNSGRPVAKTKSGAKFCPK